MENETRSPEPLLKDTRLRIIFSVTLMAVLGVASISPAFPKIIDAFEISSQSIGLLITAFTLPGVLLTPILGVFADRWGRKKILIPSLLIFGLAGGACAFIRNYELLVFARLIQGIGGASLGALNVTLIGDIFSGKQRSAAMGYNASILSIGTATYPAIGGALAMVAWYYPFLLSVLAIPIGLWVIKLDYEEPIVTQSLKIYLNNIWASINIKVMGLFITGIMTFIILYGSYLTFFPLLIGNSFNGSTFIIGILMSTMSLTTAVTSSQMGRLTKIANETLLVKVSFAIYALSLLLIPLVSTLWLLLIPTVLFGIGHGMNFPSIQTLLVGFAPKEHRAAFMSINGTILRLGQTLGPILMGIVFSIWGMKVVFYSSILIALVTIAQLHYIEKRFK